MTFEDIQRFATPTAFKKYVSVFAGPCLFPLADGWPPSYEKYLFITAINAMPDYVWCLRPGCGAGQIHSTPGVPIFKCGACGFLQCVKHEVPWHDGQSCRAYDRKGPRFKIITEKASSAQVRSTSKTCPGINCGAKIFRSGGCDHMTCE